MPVLANPDGSRNRVVGGYFGSAGAGGAPQLQRSAGGGHFVGVSALNVGQTSEVVRE